MAAFMDTKGRLEPVPALANEATMSHFLLLVKYLNP